MIEPILPGAAVGVLGSGQLGRMFALAARRMGYRVHTFSPDTDTPTGQVADLEIVAAYDDLDAAREFARNVRVVTFEFENVPAATAEAVGEYAPVRPGGHVLHVAQSRLREKTFLRGAGIPHSPWRHVTTREGLDAALGELGCPAVLKTAGFGYDGKGQVKIERSNEAGAAWDALGGAECVLEGWVRFRQEVSVVAVRGADGAFAHYGVIENAHKNHILDISTSPADVSAAVCADAEAIARAILEQLNVVGVLCVEFFLMPDGQLLVNELAPRPHNSGHLTIDACVTSQFEQQLRAVCGLPLGATDALRPAAMANLLGDLWDGGEPNWAAALALPGVKLHLYGKEDARPGRKMGHLTALADTPSGAQLMARRARLRLTKKHPRMKENVTMFRATARTKWGTLVLCGLGLATAAWAQVNLSLTVNGAVASHDVRVIGGRPYVPLADVAKAYDQTLVKKPGGYELIAAGGAGQVANAHVAKLGEELFTGQWRFKVINVQTVNEYTTRFGKDKQTISSDTGGDTLVVVDCRIKNGTKQKQELVLSTGSYGGANTALADDQEHSYAPINWHGNAFGGYDAHMDDSAPNGAYVLPGAAIDFALVFSVPPGTKPKNLVFSILKYGDRSDAATKGTDVRILLNP